MASGEAFSKRVLRNLRSNWPKNVVLFVALVLLLMKGFGLDADRALLTAMVLQLVLALVAGFVLAWARDARGRR
ncbi:hypothetical protein [Streptacidiphilus cavernicola]|uniref:ABC transporter permease n=1 Tax=Streptacidiphilus cavernicola TaxID=3342716 RepID=A0ABV6VYE7_9ACTN